MKRKPIKIWMLNEPGYEEVLGYPVGEYFAVVSTELTFAGDGLPWGITHVPSGRSASLYFRYLRDAIVAAKRIAKVNTVPWAESDTAALEPGCQAVTHKRIRAVANGEMSVEECDRQVMQKLMEAEYV